VQYNNTVDLYVPLVNIFDFLRMIEINVVSNTSYTCKIMLFKNNITNNIDKIDISSGKNTHEFKLIIAGYDTIDLAYIIFNIPANEVSNWLNVKIRGLVGFLNLVQRRKYLNALIKI
jgi:hypothetical protein